MIPFERSLSKLSENHKNFKTGLTEFKLHAQLYLLASFGIKFAGLPVTVYSTSRYVYTEHLYQPMDRTFLVGECSTGAGGEGGPRGILVLVLNFGGSIGSF